MTIEVQEVTGGWIIQAADREGNIKARMVASTPAKVAAAVKALLDSPPE